MSEMHPVLTERELAEIASFREKLAYRTVAETEHLLFMWARTGVVNRRQHTLLCKYIYQGY